RSYGDWSSDVCSSDLAGNGLPASVTNLTIANTGGSGSNIVTGNTGQAVTGLLLVQMGIYSSAGSYNNVQIQPAGTLSLTGAITRSEERRVGKEGRCRW